jgi:hypothetical protein
MRKGGLRAKRHATTETEGATGAGDSGGFQLHNPSIRRA